MRIRLKKSVTILGAIAGAAVATALIVYNVNQGNSVNVSDMEKSGLLSDLGNDLEAALNGKPQSAVIADADSGAAAASAGVMGNIFDDDAQNNESKPAAANVDDTSEQGTVQTQENVEHDTGESVSETDGKSVSGGNDEAGREDESYDNNRTEQSVDESAQEGVYTYVEVVPRTRTETVVDERVITVEKPVTVVEEVTEVEDADPVYFYSETGTAASGELTTTRRAQEALAALQAAWAEAQSGNGNRAEGDWKVPDEDSYCDSFIVFN